MTRKIPVAAFAALLAALPLRAQVAAAGLPPIPAVNAYSHWGQIERSYDEDEKSTSISLSLPFDDKQRRSFVQRGLTRGAELSAGFVFPGQRMTGYPEVVTVLLKVKRPTDTALRGDREGTNDASFALGADKSMIVAAPLVSRSGSDIVNGRPRNVEDTYVMVMTLSQFLRLVNAPSATAQLHDMKLELTGGPLEGLRDLASRISVTP